MLPFFVEQASSLTSAAQYLSAFDDTARFVLKRTQKQTLLSITTRNVPPFSFTTIDFCRPAASDSCALSVEPPRQAARREDTTIAWAVDIVTLQHVVQCFDPKEPLSLELVDGGTSLLLCQVRASDRCTRVFSINVLLDLGPNLIVSADGGLLARVPDLRGFIQMTSYAALSEDDHCVVHLDYKSGDACTLEFQTTVATSKMLVGRTYHGSESRDLRGSARCADLAAFGKFCGTQYRHSPTAALSIGFDMQGLVFFDLIWESSLGSHNARIYFCT